MSAPQAPERLRVARVARVHGVRGELRVEPLGGDASRFRPGMRLVVEGRDRDLVVRTVRSQGPDLLLGFDGVDTPEAAAGLRDAYLTVALAEARPLPPGEWFVWQLVGLEVRDPQGERLGVVEDVEPGVASDVVVVRRGADRARYPMVAAFVEDVDLEGGVLVLRPWEEER
jgi:16S rRNA processing protein RimM